MQQSQHAALLACRHSYACGAVARCACGWLVKVLHATQETQAGQPEGLLLGGACCCWCWWRLGSASTLLPCLTLLSMCNCEMSISQSSGGCKPPAALGEHTFQLLAGPGCCSSTHEADTSKQQQRQEACVTSLPNVLSLTISGAVGCCSLNC